MLYRSELTHYLNDLLAVSTFQDYSPNGLQVAGRTQVQSIVTGVSACQALLDTAVARGADTVIVHHGYFWKGENVCVTGVLKNRLKTLLEHDINLLAYHLPLDAHAIYGNNVQLAKVLDFDVTCHFTASHLHEPPHGCLGRLPSALSGEALQNTLAEKLNRMPLWIPGSADQIETIAWCTGAAEDFLPTVAQLGVDAYVTGEVRERTVHLARELGVHFYAAGHHATERYGIQALSAHLAEKFDVPVVFVDIDNPV